MKIKILLFITFFSFYSVTWGACNQCAIKNGPPDVLEDYLDTMYKVVGNLSDIVSSSNNSSTSDNNSNGEGGIEFVQQIKSRLHKTLNLIINWDGYFSYFDFYVWYGLKNEYVPEIWRDYSMIENEGEGLEDYIKNIIEKGLGDAYLTKEQVCAGITEKCDFEGNASTVLGLIANNHENFKEYFRLSILGKKASFNKTLLLVGDDFETEFGEYYNENTTSNCSSCDGNFKDRMRDAISYLSNLQEVGKEGIREWQEAIAILNGSIDEREYEQLERELLERELSRQGVSYEGSDAILNNLDRYNETGGFSLDNNFITNSFDYFVNSVKSEIQEFRDAVIEEFYSPVDHPLPPNKSVPIEKFNTTHKELGATKTVEEKIAEMYQKELPYANLQDNVDETLRARIIQMHFDLSKSIEMLNKTIKVSQKVCNDQARGEGKCDYE